MKAEQLAINSQCTFHWDLEEALDAYAAAGFKYVEPHLNLIQDWLADGHTVDETRDLFESRDLRVVASSQLEVMCFGSPDARISNLKANAVNAELIRELGADKITRSLPSSRCRARASLYSAVARSSSLRSQATSPKLVNTSAMPDLSPSSL